MDTILSSKILSTNVFFPSKGELVEIINDFEIYRGKYFVVTNAHNVYLASEDEYIFKANEDAVACISDSYILNYCSSFLHKKNVDEVFLGSKIMTIFLEEASKRSLKVGLFGSSLENIDTLKAKISIDYPVISIAYSLSPPFRELTEEENRKITYDIKASELDVLFVSLGCPKQEKWMHLNAKTTYCMNIGVGAAFDFLSKTSEDIPNIIHKYGFGWLYRFLRNPIRLFKRYFIYGSHFLLKILIQKTKIK